MSNLLSLINWPLIGTVYNDAPEPWQISFQDGASPTFEGITELHSSIFFYLVIIFVGVGWMIGSVVVNYSANASPIVYKYANHGTLIELVWTITPALILIAIAFPSFKLLYLMDIPLFDLGMFMQLAVAPLAVKAKKGRKVKVTSSCLDLVPHGVVGSTVGFGRITRYLATSTSFTKDVVSQLVGHLLGDGALTKTHTSITPVFIFTQTFKRFPLVWFVFNQLSHYCNSFPLINKGMRKGVSYPFMQVHTRAYPYFTVLYDLFYQQVNGRAVKVVDYSLLPYLNDVTLAYWAMDDGAAAGSTGFYLHTKGFTYGEVYKLVAMLHYVFGLNCTVQNHENRPVIYIRAESMPHFVNLVKPHFHPLMLYKLP